MRRGARDGFALKQVGSVFESQAEISARFSGQNRPIEFGGAGFQFDAPALQPRDMPMFRKSGLQTEDGLKEPLPAVMPIRLKRFDNTFKRDRLVCVSKKHDFANAAN